MQVTLGKCSPRFTGGEAKKKSKSQVFMSDMNSSKRVEIKWKMMVVQDLTNPMEMLRKCGIWCIETDFKFQSYVYATKFRQRLDSSPWQWSRSQGTFCQAVFGPKIDYWNKTPFIPLIWLRMAY